VDAETSPTSRVVAAVPASGARYAEIVAASGLSREAVDSGLQGALRARLLRKAAGVFYPTHVPPKPLPSDRAIDAEPMRKWRPSAKRVAEMNAAAIRREERKARHDYWAGIIKRWNAGENMGGHEIRQARKWWSRMGRPEL